MDQYDIREVLRLTGFKEKIRSEQVQYYAELPEASQVEVQKIDRVLCRRHRKQKTPVLLIPGHKYYNSMWL